MSVANKIEHDDAPDGSKIIPPKGVSLPKDPERRGKYKYSIYLLYFLPFSFCKSVGSAT